MPLFPELQSYLKVAFELASPGAEEVPPWISSMMGVAPLGHLLSLFFASLFSTSFLDCFFDHFDTKMEPK